MKRIAIDMDEVIADTMAHYLALYNAEFELELTPEDFRGKRVLEVIDPTHVERARAFFYQEEFFYQIPVMEGSRDVVHDLTRHYEVFITTAAMDVPCSFSAKFRWLEKHFPFIRPSHIVFCGDKGILQADYLIDDTVRHFSRFSGEGILYTAPHNVHETRYRRVNNWEDVRRMFLSDAIKSEDRSLVHAFPG
jgi:5'(3')-deoxyribonucleotidase